eukprot:1745391-Pleurochrysis_carterae.AAC.2
MTQEAAKDKSFQPAARLLGRSSNPKARAGGNAGAHPIYFGYCIHFLSTQLFLIIQVCSPLKRHERGMGCRR